MCQKLSKKYTIILNGTEVLLNQGYLKSLAISKQKRVLTNGIIIHNNKDLLHRVYQTGTKSVALSYHYGIHDNISSTEYQTILDDIELIKEMGLEVTLMCTINKGNYDKVIKMCEFAVKYKVRNIRFFNYLKIGNALELSDDNILSAQELAIFFYQLNTARKIYPKEILNIKRNGTFGEDENVQNKFECDAGYEEVAIALNMKVYPCIYMTKEGFEIGEYIYIINQHTIEKMFSKRKI